MVLQHRPCQHARRTGVMTLSAQSTAGHFVQDACYTCSATTASRAHVCLVTTSNRQREHGHLNPKAFVLRGVQALQGSAAREHCYYTGAERHTDACRQLRPTTCHTPTICLPSRTAHQLGTPACQKKCLGKPVPAQKAGNGAGRVRLLLSTAHLSHSPRLREIAAHCLSANRRRTRQQGVCAGAERQRARSRGGRKADALRAGRGVEDGGVGANEHVARAQAAVAKPTRSAPGVASKTVW